MIVGPPTIARAEVQEWVVDDDPARWNAIVAEVCDLFTRMTGRPPAGVLVQRERRCRAVYATDDPAGLIELFNNESRSTYA